MNLSDELLAIIKYSQGSLMQWGGFKMGSRLTEITCR